MATAFERYRIEIKLYNEHMKLLDSFNFRQDLLITDTEFAVRLTRMTPDGQIPGYEDRGTIDKNKRITGTTGFGGTLHGQIFPNGSIFLEGKGGNASFVMVATRLAPDRYRCLRRIEANRPSKFGTELDSGSYYVTTEDYLEESSNEIPTEMKTPLKM